VSVDLPLLARGKVREVYADGADLVLVASDRVSVYDVVLPTPIPDKGKVLTGLSVFWFGRTGHIVPNHFVSATDGVPGAAYAGDGMRASRTVAAGAQVEVTVPGTEVFGSNADPDQLFRVLHELAAALRDESGPRHARLSAGLTRLDSATDRMLSKLGEIGARFNRVDTVKSAAEGALVDLATSLAQVEDIDLPKTIVDLQMQEVAYKAALGATARVVQPSLLDFLR